MPGPEAVVGVGAVRGVRAAEVLAAVDAVLPPGLAVTRLATLEARAAEPGVREAARARGWALTGHPAAALAAVAVPTPSGRVAAAVGTPSVAEAAALLGGGHLVVPKTVRGRVTIAVAVPRGAESTLSALRRGAESASSALREPAIEEDGG